MKKAPDRDLLPEYDFAGGVRGKHIDRLARASNIVVLDKDVQRLFPDSAAVNAALRALGKAFEVAQGGARKARPATRQRPGTTRTGS
jgi:hypothetical protein